MKLFYPIDYDIKGDLLNIKDDKIQKVLGKYVTDKEHKFSFDRISTNDKELLATADCLNKDTSFYVLELKTYRDKELLKESMKYVMKNFPVLQTTYNKIQVVREMHE